MELRIVMSASCCPDHAGRLLLCWSEGAGLLWREQPVELLTANAGEAVLCSSLGVKEQTAVSLVGAGYEELGVVRSCRIEGSKFILTIRITDDNCANTASDRDPGALSVDSFLTEEQELQILADVEDDWKFSERSRSAEIWNGFRRALNSCRRDFRLQPAAPRVHRSKVRIIWVC